MMFLNRFAGRTELPREAHLTARCTHTARVYVYTAIDIVFVRAIDSIMYRSIHPVVYSDRVHKRC